MDIDIEAGLDADTKINMNRILHRTPNEAHTASNKVPNQNTIQVGGTKSRLTASTPPQGSRLRARTSDRT